MPAQPGMTLWFGPDGGPYVMASSLNPLPVTLSGVQTMGGAAAEGAAAANNPVRCAGWDAANIRTLLTDSSGRIIAAGAAAEAAAVAGNPLLQGVSDGANVRALRTPIVFKDVNAVAIGAIVTVWTPAAGKKFRLMGGVLSVSAAVNVLFEDNAAGAGNFVFRTPKLLVDTPFAFTLGGNGKISAAADQVLKATGSGAANLTGTLYGTEE